ncbi:MAG: DALR anticodon-binding domain-containing protein [Ruminococcus sp.]
MRPCKPGTSDTAPGTGTGSVTWLRSVCPDAAAKAYDPSKVTKYATELATLFHKFYDVCSISRDTERKQAVYCWLRRLPGH